MIQMLGAVAPLAKILFNTIEKSVPDKDLQEKLKAQLQTQLLQSNTAELQAAAKMVTLWDEVQNRWHALWQINRQTKNKKTDRIKNEK
jgi:Na+/phosphate symporter